MACSRVSDSPSTPLGSEVRRRLGFLVLGVWLALLGVEAVGAAANRDQLAGDRVVAEFAHALFEGLAGGVAVLDGEAPGVLAGGIVRAADEAAVAAELEAEAAGVAGGADAGVGAVGAGGEEMVAEVVVERVDDVRDLEFAGLLDGAAELVPEGLHDSTPIGPAAADVVELLLEGGGEAGVNVALEEAGEEGGDEAAAILGDEAAVLEADVFAVAEDGEDAGVGAGAADAELLHFFDQAGFRVARRGLGEVLVGVGALAGDRVTLVHGGQHAAFVGGAFWSVVNIFAVELEKAVEGDDGAVGAQPGAVGGDIDRDLVELGGLHLAGDGAFPDEVVKALLLGG